MKREAFDGTIVSWHVANVYVKKRLMRFFVSDARHANGGHVKEMKDIFPCSFTFLHLTYLPYVS